MRRRKSVLSARGAKVAGIPLDPDEFTRAVEAISAAYKQAGHPVTVVRRAELYASLHTSSPIFVLMPSQHAGGGSCPIALPGGSRLGGAGGAGLT